MAGSLLSEQEPTSLESGATDGGERQPPSGTLKMSLRCVRLCCFRATPSLPHRWHPLVPVLWLPCKHAASVHHQCCLCLSGSSMKDRHTSPNRHQQGQGCAWRPTQCMEPRQHPPASNFRCSQDQTYPPSEMASLVPSSSAHPTGSVPHPTGFMCLGVLMVRTRSTLPRRWRP